MDMINMEKHIEKKNKINEMNKQDKQPTVMMHL